MLDGLAAAKAAGLAVKINAVALRGVNEDELDELVAWCGDQGFDLVLIEVMPMGDIGGENRLDQYLPLSMVRARLQRRWTLDESDYRTGGPARYFTVRETGRRLGFITPLTHNFCESCNRVRLTCTGTLYMCLGQEDAADLRTPLRQSEGDEALEAAIARGDRPQAQGPRFHHRPPPQPACRRPPYECHRRVSAAPVQQTARPDRRRRGRDRSGAAGAGGAQPAAIPVSPPSMPILSFRSAATAFCSRRCIAFCRKACRSSACIAAASAF